MMRPATSGCSGNSPSKQADDVHSNNNYLKTYRSAITEPVRVFTLLVTLCRQNVAVRDTYGDHSNLKASITVPAFTGKPRKLTKTTLPEHKPTTTCTNTYSALRVISGFPSPCNDIFALLGHDAS
jgi:hypothetical protein